MDIRRSLDGLLGWFRRALRRSGLPWLAPTSWTPRAGRIFESLRGAGTSPSIGAAGPTEKTVAPDRMPVAPSAALEAKIRRLKRAAVLDIFDQLGLDIVPGQVWTYTDDDDDVAHGVEVFFRDIGVDPAAVRALKSGELKRANEILELLVDVDSAFERLEAAVRERIARRLRSGDFDKVIAAARSVAAFERIQRMAGAWPSDHRIGLFEAFLAQVQGGLDDPLSVGAGDVTAAEDACTAIIDLQDRFDLASSQYADLYAELTAVWPDDWSLGTEADRLNEDTALFEGLADRIRSSRDAAYATVQGAIAELEQTLDRLESLRAAAEAHRGGGAGPGGTSHTSARMSLREEALVFYGFERSASPPMEEVRARWKAFVWDNHPDRGDGTPAETERRTKLVQQANWLRDVLCGI
jgi:hypothetical protein